MSYVRQSSIRHITLIYNYVVLGLSPAEAERLQSAPCGEDDISAAME